MGRVVSASDLSGATVNDILLGSPALDPDTGLNVWDHELLPDMVIVMPPPDDGDQLLIAMLGGVPS